MNLTITQIHGIHNERFQVDTKDVTFIVEVETEQYDAEYCEGYVSQPSGESVTPIDIEDAWLNDEDGTKLELTTNLKNKLLCLIN